MGYGELELVKFLLYYLVYSMWLLVHTYQYYKEVNHVLAQSRLLSTKSAGEAEKDKVLWFSLGLSIPWLLIGTNVSERSLSNILISRS